jgi:hypothetical protein
MCLTPALGFPVDLFECHNKGGGWRVSRVDSEAASCAGSRRAVVVVVVLALLQNTKNIIMLQVEYVAVSNKASEFLTSAKCTKHCISYFSILFKFYY